MEVGPGDDAAVVDERTVVTVDVLVSGTHFDGRWSPGELGYKAIAASVADLAAMGARPRWAVLALTLDDPGLAPALARGVGAACRRWGVSLVGGDTTRGRQLTVGITMGGALVGAPLLRRSGRPGDLLWVTGTLGGAGVGWSQPDPSAAAWRALTRPEPPLAFALALARHGLVHAAMDLSDGLATDLPRLCAASGTGARVQSSALPLSPTLDPETRPLAWAGGEDHELLFSASPESTAALQRLAARHEVRLTPIGSLTDSGEVLLDGAAFPGSGFQHFAGAAR